MVHAANYVADDVVFTKNGGFATQPWMLMHLDDMIDAYATHHPMSGPLKRHYVRRKSL